MKPLIIILLFNLTYITPPEVYLCDSPGAKKYHYKSNCRGLSNCNYKIIKVTLEKAQKDRKTLCGWED